DFRGGDSILQSFTRDCPDDLTAKRTVCVKRRCQSEGGENDCAERYAMRHEFHFQNYRQFNRIPRCLYRVDCGRAWFSLRALGANCFESFLKLREIRTG